MLLYHIESDVGEHIATELFCVPHSLEAIAGIIECKISYRVNKHITGRESIPCLLFKVGVDDSKNAKLSLIVNEKHIQK